MNSDNPPSENDTERFDPDGPKVLVEEDLVADENADVELGGAPASADRPGDDEIHGSRFTLVRHAVEPVGEGEGAVLVVVLEASFQPAPGTRFSSAQVEISLFMPPEAIFADLAPREVREAEPVVFTLKSGATLNLGIKRVEAGVGRDATTEVSRYHCQVIGTGIGSRRVRWTLYENEAATDGIGSHQRFVIALSGHGPFELEAMTSCSLVRQGLVGIPGRVRELILGPHMKEGRLSRFTITDVAERSRQDARRWYERVPHSN